MYQIIFHVTKYVNSHVSVALLDEVMKDEVYNATGDVDEFGKKVNVYRSG